MERGRKKDKKTQAWGNNRGEVTDGLAEVSGKQREGGQILRQSGRNYGLDLLRMVSMFLIVNLHVLGQGGAMVRIAGNESTYYAAWFLETCAYCAVDCYGLLSGYVGVKGKPRLGRFLELWLQVFFYSAGITLVYYLAALQFLTGESFWQAVFPVCAKTYWYFSAYAGLFFLMPYLNRMVLALEERERKRLAAVLFFVFSVATAIPKAARTDFLSLVGGYSFAWLLILYLFGACLGTCTFRRWKLWKYGAAYLGLSAFSWIFKILVENYTRSMYGEAMFGRVFTGYAAPTMFLCAVCLLLLFEGLKIKGEWLCRLIKAASPLAFSVYIIHTHPLVWESLMKGAFSSYRYLHWAALLPAVLLSAVLIYTVCSLIDLLRKKLFDILDIRKRCQGASDALGCWWSKKRI